MLSRLARARAGSLAIFPALAAAAALVDLGRFHALEHADSIVPVLVSLQRWTFFYWDQERYGMLVPLLALPLRDPLWNLVLQRGLLVLAGLAAVVLLARHVLAGRDWRIAGALAAASILLAWPAGWTFEYLGDQPYGLALALALAGLAWAEPAGSADPGAGAVAGAVARRGLPRLAAGLLLVVAAHWVNAATALFLLPLAAARAAADRLEGEPRAEVRDRLLVDAALLALGFAAGQVMLRLYPVLSGTPLRLDLGTLPVAEWPRAWAALLGRAARESGAWPAVLAATAAAGLVLPWPAGGRGKGRRAALARAAALAAAALAWALLAGTFRWIAENAFHWRYLAPSAVLLQLAVASLAAEPLARAVRLARPALFAAIAAVPLAALASAGWPSPARVRADLDAVAGPLGPGALAAGCTLVAGSYWSVWPAVWRAAQVRHEAGLPPALWGISHRSNPTLAQWGARRGDPALRICVPAGEEAEAERWLRAYHLWPAREVERRGAVSVRVAAGG